jgi:hypothetical protein
VVPRGRRRRRKGLPVPEGRPNVVLGRGQRRNGLPVPEGRPNVVLGGGRRRKGLPVPEGRPNVVLGEWRRRKGLSAKESRCPQEVRPVIGLLLHDDRQADTAELGQMLCHTGDFPEILYQLSDQILQIRIEMAWIRTAGRSNKGKFKTIIRIHILKRWVVFFSVTDPDPLHFWTRDGEKVGIHH